MKLGILGGTFDPVHLAHLFIAEESRELLRLDKVLFIPAGTPSHRKPAVASGADRLKMVELAIADHPGFEVCAWEIGKQSRAYTWDTLNYLRTVYPPKTEFYLVVGADAFQALNTWYRAADLVKEAAFAVAGREGAALPANLPAGTVFHRLETAVISLSGSEIRERVRRGRTIRYLVPEPVRLYIAEHELYQ